MEQVCTVQRSALVACVANKLKEAGMTDDEHKAAMRQLVDTNFRNGFHFVSDGEGMRFTLAFSKENGVHIIDQKNTAAQPS